MHPFAVALSPYLKVAFLAKGDSIQEAKELMKTLNSGGSFFFDR